MNILQKVRLEYKLFADEVMPVKVEGVDVKDVLIDHDVLVLEGQTVQNFFCSLSGQSYKVSTIVIYESRVINISNLLVITTYEEL